MCARVDRVVLYSDADAWPVEPVAALLAVRAHARDLWELLRADTNQTITPVTVTESQHIQNTINQSLYHVRCALYAHTHTHTLANEN